jgi:hypothetical protein
VIFPDEWKKIINEWKKWGPFLIIRKKQHKMKGFNIKKWIKYFVLLYEKVNHI